jgi:hypothetical protein
MPLFGDDIGDRLLPRSVKALRINSIRALAELTLLIPR